jgi:hypothetical protein
MTTIILKTELLLDKFKNDVSLIPNNYHQQKYITSNFYYIKNTSIKALNTVYQNFKT